LIEAVPTKPTAGGMKQLAWATRPLNRRQLNSRQLKFLARLPVTQTLVSPGSCDAARSARRIFAGRSPGLECPSTRGGSRLRLRGPHSRPAAPFVWRNAAH
jgi:hypothetical protein